MGESRLKGLIGFLAFIFYLNVEKVADRYGVTTMLVDFLDRHAPVLSKYLVNDWALALAPVALILALLLFWRGNYKDRERRIWPWQWREVDRRTGMHVGQWAAVICGRHSKLALDQHNADRTWYSEFQYIKSKIKDGSLATGDGSVNRALGLYVSRAEITKLYASEGRFVPALFPERRIWARFLGAIKNTSKALKPTDEAKTLTEAELLSPQSPTSPETETPLKTPHG